MPTGDGPSHVYNAVVLRDLMLGAPEMERAFFIDPRPHPNWLTHLLLAATLGLGTVAAQKITVSAIVLLFLAGCWRLAGAVDRRNRVYAFLVMPLAYHLLFQFGFYNYSLGVALVPWAMEWGWRRREESTWPAVLGTAAWLVFIYFAHVVPAVVAAGLLAALWLKAIVRHGWRSHWRDALAFVPLSLLLLWFFLQPKPPGGTWTWEGALLWTPLLNTALLLTFDLRQLVLGRAMAFTFGVLIMLTLVIETIDHSRRRLRFRERDFFLLLTVFTLAAYLAAPISVQEGLVLKARILIFAYLVILPWLTPRVAQLPLAIVLALVAVTNVFFIRDCWKRNDRLIAEAGVPLESVVAGRTIVPLIFDRSSPHSTLPLLGHAMAYGAAERHLVHLGNYEANLPFFPVQFRPELQRPAIFDLETTPQNYEPDRWPAVDYVYTWKMPPDAEVAARLAATTSWLSTDTRGCTDAGDSRGVVM